MMIFRANGFNVMNRRLKVIDSEIVNVKISNHQLKAYHLPIAYLSYATFFRYFIADFVVEEKAFISRFGHK